MIMNNNETECAAITFFVLLYLHRLKYISVVGNVTEIVLYFFLRF